MKGLLTKHQDSWVICHDVSENKNVVDNRYTTLHKDNLPVDESMLGKKVDFEIIRNYGSDKNNIPATYAKIIYPNKINTWNDLFKDIEGMDVYLPIRLKNLLKNRYHDPIKK
jgi:hypothetical protein